LVVGGAGRTVIPEVAAVGAAPAELSLAFGVIELRRISIRSSGIERRGLDLCWLRTMF